jgi:hypothetical protein
MPMRAPFTALATVTLAVPPVIETVLPLAASAALKLAVAPLLTATARGILFKAPAELTWSVPELTVTSPLKVLAPDRIRGGSL